VNETVQLAKEFGLGPQAGFVNAVLRGWLRERDETRRALEALKLSQPALGYSHPEWLCERWRKRLGEDHLRQLLQWNNTPAVTYARVNTLKPASADVLMLWAKESVQCVPRQFDWAGNGLIYELNSHPPLASLTTFQHGLFYIQDPSTLLAVQMLNPQPGETILDLCAAPGGKTTYMAQLMENRGRIVAQDPHPKRLRMIRENCERLGVTCVDCSAPTTIDFPELSISFDRVLVDVPCSNTGVMRRRVDLRWRVRLEEIQRLRVQQLELLHDAAIQVKPGGVLVYSTCSLEAEENREVMNEFLAAHRDFELEQERELFPFSDGVDGAYVARTRRA
jgi:16S rRNA (cytosine967-C5)-methyltransferase